jgi:hypothetical protein
LRNRVILPAWWIELIICLKLRLSYKVPVWSVVQTKHKLVVVGVYIRGKASDGGKKNS